MQSIRTDTTGGFDAFIEEQRGLPGRCRVTLAQFDDTYEEVYADRDLADVPPLELRPARPHRPPRRPRAADHHRRRATGRRSPRTPGPAA